VRAVLELVVVVGGGAVPLAGVAGGQVGEGVARGGQPESGERAQVRREDGRLGVHVRAELGRRVPDVRQVLPGIGAGRILKVEGHSGDSNYFGKAPEKKFSVPPHFSVVPTQFLMELGAQPSKLNNSNCHF